MAIKYTKLNDTKVFFFSNINRSYCIFLRICNAIICCSMYEQYCKWKNFQKSLRDLQCLFTFRTENDFRQSVYF